MAVQGAQCIYAWMNEPDHNVLDIMYHHVSYEYRLVVPNRHF